MITSPALGAVRMRRGAVRFGEKARRAEENGAVAVLIINTDDEPYVPLGTPADDAIQIPVVCIGKAAGDMLLPSTESKRSCEAVVSIRFQSRSAMESEPHEDSGVTTLPTATWEEKNAATRFLRLVRTGRGRPFAPCYVLSCDSTNDDIAGFVWCRSRAICDGI